MKILSRGNIPLMFTFELQNQVTIYFPTIYLLNQMEDLACFKVILKKGAEDLILNGDVLMWQDIKSLNSNLFAENDLAVIYLKND
jgi:predicted ribosome-associated RNA-binding protein Tma20